MLDNKYLDLKTVRIQKVVPSPVKRNGLPVSAQVIFLCWEGVGRSGKVSIQRSQTFHVRLESDGNYHWRGEKSGLNTKGEVIKVQIHHIFEPDDLMRTRLPELPAVATAKAA